MSREDLVNEILKEDGLYDSAVAEWMRQDAITVTDDVYIFVNFNETVRREITEHAVGKKNTNGIWCIYSEFAKVH